MSSSLVMLNAVNSAEKFFLIAELAKKALFYFQKAFVY
jgi:hypothetical protein